MITFGQAKRILAKYVGGGGRTADAPEVYDFVIEVLQYLLNRGTDGSVRKFLFYSQSGNITLPRELQVPLKIKIEGNAGTVRSRYFEYGSGTQLDGGYDCSTSLLEDPNIYPTAFEINSAGERVGVQSTVDSPGAYIIVKGEDALGNRVYTEHKGEQIVGEYISLIKGKLNIGQVKFSKITEVSCTVTKGYKELWSVSDSVIPQRTFLSAYEPQETNPGYKKARVLIPGCPASARISLIGRIKLKDYYSDEDLIPFENLHLLSTAGQTIQSTHNSDVNTAVAKTQIVDALITNEANYNKPNVGMVMDINRNLMGRAILSLRRRCR